MTARELLSKKFKSGVIFCVRCFLELLASRHPAETMYHFSRNRVACKHLDAKVQQNVICSQEIYNLPAVWGAFVPGSAITRTSTEQKSNSTPSVAVMLMP